MEKTDTSPDGGVAMGEKDDVGEGCQEAGEVSVQVTLSLWWCGVVWL